MSRRKLLVVGGATVVMLTLLGVGAAAGPSRDARVTGALPTPRSGGATGGPVEAWARLVVPRQIPVDAVTPNPIGGYAFPDATAIDSHGNTIVAGYSYLPGLATAGAVQPQKASPED